MALKQEIGLESAFAAMDIGTDNRTFVGRDSGIFVHTPSKSSVVKAFTPKHGDTMFSPAKMLLRDQNAKMSFLSPVHRNIISNYDTEKGVETSALKFKLTDDVDFKIKDFELDRKYSNFGQEGPITTIRLAGGNTIAEVNVDFREKKRDFVVADLANSTIAKKGFGFTSILPSIDGEVATSSSDGVVRLYSEIGKKAKNVLDLAGESIIGVDISKNKDWILWTTKEYLAIVRTRFEHEGKKMDAFAQTITKAIREVKMPIMLLKLLPQDLENMRLTTEEVFFSIARFDNGPAIDEFSDHTLITTSTGNYEISWRMKDVAKAYDAIADSDENYAKIRPRIKTMKSDVMALRTNFDKKPTVVVALKDELEFDADFE